MEMVQYNTLLVVVQPTIVAEKYGIIVVEHTCLRQARSRGYGSGYKVSSDDTYP